MIIQEAEKILLTYDTTRKSIRTLSEVMAALRDKQHGGYAIDQDGLFIRIKPNYKFGWDTIPGFETPPVWNIYKDNIFLQSDETKIFLAQLLK